MGLTRGGTTSFLPPPSGSNTRTTLMSSYYRQRCSGACGKYKHEESHASSSKKRQKRIPVTHSMIHKKRFTATNTHLINSNGHPTYCINCAVKLLQEDKDGIYIGLLEAGQSVAYAAAAAPGQPHQLLLQNGYCVVSPSVTLNTDWTTFVDQCLMPQFENCARTNLPLLANSLNHTSIYKNDKERRWANIYPAEYETKSKDEKNLFLKDIDRFSIGITTALFPHDHYCMSAHNARQFYLGEEGRQMTAPLQVLKKMVLHEETTWK